MEKKKGLTIEWKEHLLPILNTFTDNTPGTFIEHKTNSVVWHYRKADPELGKTRSIELKTVLQSLLPNGLSLLDGNKIIELVSSDVNKGVAALDISNKKSMTLFLLPETMSQTKICLLVYLKILTQLKLERKKLLQIIFKENRGFNQIIKFIRIEIN